MFKLVLHLLLVRFALSSNSADTLEVLNLYPPVLRQKGFLEESLFPPLKTFHVNAKAAKESKYPWIARIVHSRTADIPHMCTAVCIDEAIYITAARCIYYLKVKHTTIFHMTKKFEALAFVLPSKPTKQMFDDIGIIVVDKKKVKGVKWAKIQLFNKMNRTDTRFQWIEKLNTIKGKREYKVVGYALEKDIFPARIAERKFELRELDVTVSHIMCNQILEEYRKAHGYKVPCYHSCTIKEFEMDRLSKPCVNYLGVEGAALIEIGKTNKLVGLATWGAYFRKFELPVGFSVVNSENFFKDLSCARLIMRDKGVNIKKGDYQKLCDKIK